MGKGYFVVYCEQVDTKEHKQIVLGIVSPMKRMKISVGQALLVLLEHYKTDMELTDELKNLYLMGAVDINTQKRIDQLLKDKVLKSYVISKEPSVINDDPTRRYFESHLARLTADFNIDRLEINDLEDLYQTVLDLIPEQSKTADGITLILSGLEPKKYKEKIENTAFFESNQAMEFAFAVYRLQVEIDSIKNKKDQSHKDLSPKEAQIKVLNLQKQQYLVKLAIAGVILASSHGALPLNIYDVNNGVFSSINRGRISKSEDNFCVGSHHYGLVKSHMPIGRDDPVYSNINFPYTKPSEGSNCDLKAGWPKDTFNEMVHPYANAISGTILCQLRVLCALKDNEHFADTLAQFFVNESREMGRVEIANLTKNYKSSIGFQKSLNLDISAYIQCFIGTMLFQSGGHTLKEYMAPVELDIVRKRLEFYSSMTMRNLFLESNRQAFDAAIELSVNYNRQIIRRQTLHAELKDRVLPVSFNSQRLSTRVKLIDVEHTKKTTKRLKSR